MLKKEEVKALAKILDARSIRNKGHTKPLLRLITPPTSKLLDSIARDAHLKRITFLERRYSLRWLVDQQCFGVASVTLLEDCDLIRLLSMMERARECIAEGVSFEDADLVRPIEDIDAEFADSSAEVEADKARIGASKMTALRPKPRDWSRSPF
jgi:hypothetical protein